MKVHQEEEIIVTELSCTHMKQKELKERIKKKKKRHHMHGNQMKVFQQVQSKIRELSCTEMELKE